ncbi:MAG TPA: hypothetical protein VEH62_11895, partial [Gemmatimonadales bacterium]|nr:hypothetical protein [Gemmatimonadales bacterium]
MTIPDRAKILLTPVQCMAAALAWQACTFQLPNDIAQRCANGPTTVTVSPAVESVEVGREVALAAVPGDLPAC